MPAIGCLRGPMGNGGYLYLDLFRYSEEKGQWMVEGGEEWDRISSWNYDSESDSLSLNVWKEEDSGEEDTWSIEMRKMLSEYMRAPK